MRAADDWAPVHCDVAGVAAMRWLRHDRAKLGRLFGQPAGRAGTARTKGRLQGGRRPRMKNLPQRIPTADLRLAPAAPKVPDDFYRSRAWREARELCLALHSFRCVECPPEASRPRRLFVDHRVEIKDGGAPLDQSNLRPLCGSHHTIKTVRTRADRFRDEGAPNL